MNFVTEYGKGVHNFFTFQWLLCLWNCRAAASWRCRGSEPRLPRAIGRGGTRSDKATADGGDPVAATRVKISTCPRHWVARSSPLFIAFRMRRLLKKLAYAESGLRQPLLRARSCSLVTQISSPPSWNSEKLEDDSMPFTGLPGRISNRVAGFDWFLEFSWSRVAPRVSPARRKRSSSYHRLAIPTIRNDIRSNSISRRSIHLYSPEMLILHLSGYLWRNIEQGPVTQPDHTSGTIDAWSIPFSRKGKERKEKLLLFEHTMVRGNVHGREINRCRGWGEAVKSKSRPIGLEH